MIAKVMGEYVERRQGKRQDGQPYDFTVILSGNETVSISNYDPGAAVKRLDKVEVLCEIRHNKKDNVVYVNQIRG